MQRHPIHVVTAWIGNTPKIALAHYLQTLEGDFAKAVAGATPVQNAAQTGVDPSGLELTQATEPHAF